MSDMPHVQQYMQMYMQIFLKGNSPKILSNFQQAWGGGQSLNFISLPLVLIYFLMTLTNISMTWFLLS